MVIMARACMHDDGVVQHGSQNQNDAKLFFVSFLWLGPINLMKRFQRTNVQKEESRIRINTDRSSQEDRERLNAGENDTEHCHEVKRVKQMKQILNNAVKQGDKELEKGGEMPETQIQRSTSQINRCGGINVQPRKDSRTIHQVIHKRNQTWFVHL